MDFKKVEMKDLEFNAFTLMSQDWPLLTAGNKENDFNTMTISWGHIGSMWGNSNLGTGATVVVYVRPQRYTKKFMDENEMFTVSVLPAEYKKTLSYLGTVSGKYEDKVAKAGLTPAFTNNTTYFTESNLVLVCRKLYSGELKEEGFIDKNIPQNIYPTKDFHTMYFGEIVEVLKKV